MCFWGRCTLSSVPCCQLPGELARGRSLAALDLVFVCAVLQGECVMGREEVR